MPDSSERPLRFVQNVTFGDCDPAGIVYTGSIVNFALLAVERYFAAILGGQSWFELNLDHQIGTPFVNLDTQFKAPVTGRDSLNCDVVLTHFGRTSLGFRVDGYQSGTHCFTASLVAVFADRQTLQKAAPPRWIREAFEAERRRCELITG
ncbi:acyl-CoA thioesterase [Afifella pfennigii]|uniref:acyl-CoA thioesterase n=1 Tax=Afifella pfennigii TaxID=209897 RepID=UPI00068F078D|nr:acyl-CoA thioesterase [Afifella pfennigii]